jgi:hypothetical protein
MASMSRLVLAFLFVISLRPLPAGTVLFSEPEADTYILGAEPEKNFGDATSFQVRNCDNKKYSRIGYIGFDLGDKITSKITGAKLTLTLMSVYKNRPNPAEIEIYGKAGDDWKEKELTDDKAAWKSTGIKNPPADVRLLGSITVPPSGEAIGAPFPMESAELAEFLESARASGEKKVTFLVVEKQFSPNVVAFVTKENTSFPPTSLEIKVAGN